ncbi:MAG: tRNA-specific adenosine deaminase [Lysobacteraceae bacterium]|nr:MAG: tRNA-specific adenosine deaminase [Xanthomonadaceae bacterium]
MPHAEVRLSLPHWVQSFAFAPCYPDAEAQVALAIALAERNLAEGTGGPFGAALFDGAGRLLGVGVNRVLPEHCSAAHAEMMAFMTAQQRLGGCRLNDPATGVTAPVTLATSAQPCCMCYGASFWAGLDRMLIGARAEDVMRLTEFDEGPLPADWVGELERRGIVVRRDLLRERACAVLRRYGEQGGPRY